MNSAPAPITIPEYDYTLVYVQPPTTHRIVRAPLPAKRRNPSTKDDILRAVKPRKRKKQKRKQ